MTGTLVDSNVLLDVLTNDPEWYAWSSAKIAECTDEGYIFINPIIYAEISAGYDNMEDLDAAVPEEEFRRIGIPLDAAFLAGKAFVQYRRRGGQRLSTLPDFFIGAHAAVAGLRLLTRDPSRYRTYFPGLDIIAPEEPDSPANR